MEYTIFISFAFLLLFRCTYYPLFVYFNGLLRLDQKEFNIRKAAQAIPNQPY